MNDPSSSQRVISFSDTYWYCRGPFANKTDKPIQCDDEPTRENGMYENPSDDILLMLTILQILALMATGANIACIRGASIVTLKALHLVEDVSPSSPVNLWKSTSVIFNSLLPQVSIFWTPHIVFYLRRFKRSFELLNATTTSMESSLAKGTAPDTKLPSDALWIKTMPRVLFIELYIKIRFFKSSDIIDNMQRVFDFVDSELSGTKLGEMRKGGGTAVEMARSPLAVYDCQDSFAGDLGWGIVIEPRLRKDVTKTTKTLLRTDGAKLVQNSNPAPRFMKRLNERESLKHVQFSASAHDSSGLPVSFDMLNIMVEQADKVARLVSIYKPVLIQISNRLKSKSRSVISSKKSMEGGDSFVGSRGLGLSVLREGKRWVSAQILLGSLKMFEPDLEKKPSVGPLLDLHILFPDSTESKNCLSDFVIVCKSSAKPGSFQPASWEKASIQHEITNVCFRSLILRATRLYGYRKDRSWECVN
jgi:hypothetical protein